MSKSKYQTTSSQGAIARLENIADDFAVVLDQQTFWTSELPGGKQQQRATVARLKSCGAVESIGMHKKELQDNHGSYVNKWEWTKHRDCLIDYMEDRDELPCGDRAHIPPETNEQGQYLCKFCGTPYTEAAIRRALP